MGTLKKASPKKMVKAPIKKSSAKKTIKKSRPKSSAKNVVSTKVKLKKPIRKSKPKDSFCYFTTACTEYYGLSDNCYQLEALRKFRDTEMVKTIKDKKLVKLYYKVAPNIVARIKNDLNRDNEFKKIFIHINFACELISKQKNSEAKAEYTRMVYYLMNKYS
jgi:hypothetical protein